MINLGTKKYLKRNPAERSTTPFPSAQKIGIIFNKTKHLDIDLISSFVKRLEMQGKQVSVLCYEPRKKVIQKSFKTFSWKDIKWNGKFKSFRLKKFIRTDFDYLFSLNTSPILPLENILARSKAKCRIGGFHQKKNNCEMMIDLGRNRDEQELMNLMIQYTQMIKQ